MHDWRTLAVVFSQRSAYLWESPPVSDGRGWWAPFRPPPSFQPVAELRRLIEAERRCCCASGRGRACARPSSAGRNGRKRQRSGQETRQRRGRRVWHLWCGLIKLNTWTHHLFRTAERRRIRKKIGNYPKLTKTHPDIKPNRTNGSGKANTIACNPEWGFFYIYKIGLYREKKSLGEEREPWPCLMFGSSWCSTATLGYLRHITSHHDHHKNKF